MQPSNIVHYSRHMIANYQSRAGGLSNRLMSIASRGSSRNFDKHLTRRTESLYLPALEKIVGDRLGSSIFFHLYKLEDENQAAHFLLEEIIYYLEKRVSFRRLKSVLLQELKESPIEGIRIVCSGRVGGRSKKAQRAQKEGFQVGQTLSHVFSSKLSFACGSGLTPFGKVGVKVWICYRQSPPL
jgi:ribosomal protein S3